MSAESRFDDRVAEYVAHRPSYPTHAVDFVVQVLGLAVDDEVADLGSGTGIFSALLLDRGLRVAAVEPNARMRAAAERTLGARAGFSSHPGHAEATGLADHGVAAVVAAQAFHWFDAARARREVQRIVRARSGTPNVALIWNARRATGSPFLEGYEQLLRERSVDYLQVQHRGSAPAEQLERFFDGTPSCMRSAAVQVLDWEGLRGRAASSSYVPRPGHPAHDRFFAELHALYQRTQRAGVVQLEYEVQVYCADIFAGVQSRR